MNRDEQILRLKRLNVPAVCVDAVERADLQRLLQESDFLSLHLRGTPQTRGIIGAAELAMMKPTAYLINTARAVLVDEQALYEALASGRLAGAGLDTAVDTANSPLIDLPNVVSTPHIGNRCTESLTDVIAMAIDNALTVLHGSRPAHIVNSELLETIARGGRGRN